MGPTRTAWPRWRGRRGPLARAISAIGLSAVLAANPLTAPRAAAGGFAFATEASQEAILSEMAIGPAAVERDGITYVAFQGIGYDPYVASYDGERGWLGPVRAGTNPLQLDAHGAPALHIDAEGYLHLYYGSHGGALKHARSAMPRDIAAWVDLPDAAVNATYPQVVPQPAGSMSLFCRSAAADPDWLLRISADDGDSFGPAQVLLDADSTTHWYAHAEAGPSGRLHMAFVRLDAAQVRAGKTFVRYDVYYATRDTGGTWRNAEGDPLTIPIDRAEADASCRVVDSGSWLTNEVTVKEDAEGRPCLLFLTGANDTSHVFHWRFMRHAPEGWTTTTIGQTDHFFDAGCLEPMPDGSFEAFVVLNAENAAVGALDGDYRGRGGSIRQYRLQPGETAWRPSSPTALTPPRGFDASLGTNVQEQGVAYSDPVLVRGHTGQVRLIFTDWTNDESDFWRRLFAVDAAGEFVSPRRAVSTERLGGINRIATATQISRRAFPERAFGAVIAGSTAWPDALCGAPLATKLGGPILLTERDHLSVTTRNELQRLGVRRVTVLGGTGVVSEAVVAELRAAGVTSVDRAAGGDRYQTAYQIALRLHDPTRPIDTCVVVDGRNWADAVSVAPVAAANGWPIIPMDDWAGRPTGRAVTALFGPTAANGWTGITNTLVAGGTGAVSEAVATAFPGVTRCAGKDRYETSAEVAQFALGHGCVPERIHLATGRDFPDGLVATSLASRDAGPVLLVPGTELGAARSFLSRNTGGTSRIFAFGTSEVILDHVIEDARSAVEP